jgi:DNA-binding CsgD family transcriptional regulator
LQAADGDVASAARLAGDAAEVAAGQNQPLFEALALYDVARFTPSRRVADRLDELARVVDSRLVQTMAMHTRGLVDDDPFLLDEAADSFAAMTADLFSAEASLSASRSYRHAGRRSSAFAALERAKQLSAACDNARTHALAWADQPEDLTPREREVADLAAANASSREIAERLGISSRTVDNLLGRVYSKLGVSGRQELRALRSESG